MKRRAVMVGIAGAVALLATGSARAFTMGETNAALATQGTLNASGGSNPAAARKSVSDGLKRATATRSKAAGKAGGAKAPGGFGGGKGGKGSWVGGGGLGSAKTGGKGSWVGAGASKGGGGKGGWASASAKSTGWASGGAMGGKGSKKSAR